MNSSAKIAVFLLLAAAAAAVAFFALGGTGGAPSPLDSGPEPVAEERPENAPPEDLGPVTVVQPETPKADERVAVTPGQVGAGTDCRQGVTGRAVDAIGNPAAEIDVYLVEGQGKDLFQMMLLAQQGVTYPPLAHARTDPAGNFQLGLQRVVDGKRYEVRFVADRFADHVLPNLTITQDEWYDAGVIKLEHGIVLTGQVTVQGNTGLPIPGAQVTVKINEPFQSLTPTPGREKGIVAVTDNGGFFRFENVKPGIVTVAAVAQDFAKVERTNIQITAEGDNKVNFELPQGMALAGTVTDADGSPVANAQVTATAISSKTPMSEEVRTDVDGSFEIIGLVDQPFMLRAVAVGYVSKDVKPIMPGTMENHIVLERQGAARLLVLASSGRRLTRYSFIVKTYYPNQEHYGNVPNAQLVKVEPRDLDNGIYEISGLNPGSYVVEVHADEHAKTYSDPFTIAVGPALPEVTVTMKSGGKIQGLVVDASGAPLAGVGVSTMPEYLDENPFTEMFAALVPYKITKTNTKTDPNGRFLLTRLAPGAYQIKFTHPDHYDLYQKGHQVADGQTTTIERVQMLRGTLVSGTARVDGVPAAQVKVTISSVPETAPAAGGLPGTGGAGGGGMFMTDAITDNDGNFVFPRRIPPGRYQARAARQTLGNPLLQVVDFAKTEQTFDVGRGQESYTLHFNISSNDR